MSAVVIFSLIQYNSVAITAVDFDTIYDAENAVQQWLEEMRSVELEVRAKAVVLDKGEDQ